MTSSHAGPRKTQTRDRARRRRTPATVARNVAIGGGGNAVDIEDDLNGIIPASSNSYQVEFEDNGAPGRFAGFVLCSDSARPFK